MNKNPIDQRQLRQIVEGSQGITRTDMVVRLNTNKDRMGRAQKDAVSRGWLFIQVQNRGTGKGQIQRYFTMKYAVDNKLQKTLKPENKLGNREQSAGQHSPHVQDFIERCHFIDSLWPAP